MTWIEILIGVIVVTALFRYGLLVWGPVKYFVSGLARIECRAPRVSAGSAALTPAVVRESLDYHCTRWKGHDGPHEAETTVEIGPGERTSRVVQWDR